MGLIGKHLMYQVRLWSSRHARFMERIYHATEKPILALLRGVTKIAGTKLDGSITAAEASVKGLLFDCQMCGNCALSKTGMSCPMNCPKTIRNGPCGGVRENGMCEVKPEMRCVWVEAWNGAGKMKEGHQIRNLEFAIDHRHKGTSSWLRLARDE